MINNYTLIDTFEKMSKNNIVFDDYNHRWKIYVIRPNSLFDSKIKVLQG